MSEKRSSRSSQMSGGVERNINENEQYYDEYQRRYEEQLRAYSQLDEDFDEDFDDDPELEFRQLDRSAGQSGGSSSYRSAPPRRTSSSAAQRTSQSQPQKKSGGQSSKTTHKKKSNGRQRSSSQQHISRDEPLRFGSHNGGKQSGGKKNSAKGGKSNNKKDKNKNMKKEKRSNPIKTFFKCLLVLVLVVFILLQLLIFRYLGMVDYVDTGKRLVTNASMKSDDVMNVLVIGSDTRSKEERGRTDSMILLSVNKNTKDITMTSFMRDMYVEIPEHGWSKMNAAYVYGGAELLMDTIELNFDIEVDKYIYIDFYSFIDIVDAVGGIELDVTDEEAVGMTDPMAEQNDCLGKKKGSDYLTSGGKGLLLNGNQALAYARLRYVGNADFERTERQRTVVTKIFEKAKTLGPVDLDNFARVCMSNLTTNMTKTELYFLTYRVPFMLKYDIDQLRIPAEGAYTYGSHDGQSTLDVDFDACKRELSEKIYG